ncbi:uncharacterized protein PgNI_09137 [Pyricularia grisea]|uniref:Uncharacterized protein n=1 Tax=Pyricularia grisea TaxID=148305 RepID=A0A6P8ASP1_PYRGI|nr:uncharacterized protein PgNI_09137 [Pyricularia grisea]TLD05123.1 hypothetical protein PgNI_09137 [Pyricularia grisea]
MRYSTLALCAAAVCQVVSTNVPEFVYLGEHMSPAQMEYIGAIAPREMNNDEVNLYNYHPTANVLMRLVINYVYRIHTAGITSSFREAAALYAKANIKHPNPDQQEWLAIAAIPKNNIQGWYKRLENGEYEYVSREAYEIEMKEKAEQLAKQRGAKRPHARSRCLFSGGCIPF